MLPKDIPLRDLKATMESFADQLGVKCTFVDEVKPERINCWLCHRGKAEIDPMPQP